MPARKKPMLARISSWDSQEKNFQKKIYLLFTPNNWLRRSVFYAIM